jgi:hypothetical protein
METHRRGAPGAPPVGPLGAVRFGALPGAVVVALLALLAGCGGASSGHVKGTNVVQASQTSNGSTVQESQSSSGSGNVTNESTTSSGSLSQSSFSAKGESIRIIGGSGNATISLTLDHGSRLLWSNTVGNSFTLHDDDSRAAVNSSSGSGETSLSAGDHKLSINGDVWTVVIRPS